MELGGDQYIPRPESWRVGNPAPWAHLTEGQRHFKLGEVLTALSDHPPARNDHIAHLKARPAAVLVALFEEDGEVRVILTKRADSMPTHRGEIVFPGGKFDPVLDADLAAAALREAHEEIGLDAELVEVVAELDHVATLISAFAITPFVGVLSERPAVHAESREVTSVFDVALWTLFHEATWHEERWSIPPFPGSAEGMNDASMPFFELPGETVWGATARILTSLLGYLASSR